MIHLRDVNHPWPLWCTKADEPLKWTTCDRWPQWCMKADWNHSSDILRKMARWGCGKVFQNFYPILSSILFINLNYLFDCMILSQPPKKSMVVLTQGERYSANLLVLLFMISIKITERCVIILYLLIGCCPLVKPLYCWSHDMSHVCLIL